MYHYLMYNYFILSSLNYGILVWSFNTDRLFKLLKRAVRVISKSKFNAHTDPLFQNLQILKIEDLHKLNILKFYYKLIHKKHSSILSYYQHDSRTALPYTLISGGALG